ncbi:MAG: GYD domain-containing protein [Betaproteobacteria bacterium]|nr:GYD domain-containing protein [Betaproteobacteria bacterium]
MVTYISLLNFTDKGAQSIKETTKRSAAARQAAQAFGVTLRDMHWTLGAYDAVCVLEAKDEASLMAFSMATATQGNVRTQSLRAFTASEVDAFLARMP